MMPEPEATHGDDLEAAVDVAIAACDGDPRAAIKALIVANDFLHQRVEYLTDLVSPRLRAREAVVRGFAVNAAALQPANVSLSAGLNNPGVRSSCSRRNLRLEIEFLLVAQKAEHRGQPGSMRFYG